MGKVLIYDLHCVNVPIVNISLLRILLVGIIILQKQIVLLLFLQIFVVK